MKRFLPALLALVFPRLAMAAEPPLPAKLDIYVSTGDNHFLGSSLPIDSPAGIEATFDLLRDVSHARRIYWRGLEEACWVETMIARPENCRYDSLWKWLQELYREVQPDLLAAQAANARGIEFWGVASLWDWGSQADTPGFGDYPFTFESRLRLEHPEWVPVDKHGARRQGGPIELAYPEARKALVDLTVRETLKVGYAGIAFLTYVENYSIRFQDEFGFSEPIVRDFKKLHGIDITREPFKRGASREDWMRLRGTYLTAFLRELKAALAPHGVKLGVIISSNDPRQPHSWNVPELMPTAGSHTLDLETWVREGLVEALIVNGNHSPHGQFKVLDDLRWLCRGTKTEVSFMTSGPFREGWKKYQQEGVPTVLAVSDDVQHLERGFVPEQTAAGLQAKELPARQRALAQVIASTLNAGVAEIAPLARAANLIERRLALQALGKSKSPEAVPLLEAALVDSENGARCVAALALAETHGADSWRHLLAAAEKHGNHMLRECVIIALRRLKPFPAAEIGDAAQRHASEHAREAAMRALVVHASPALLPVFREGMKDKAQFPRYSATEALGSLPRSAEAIELLLGALDHADHVVVNRAAVSLGSIAKLNKAEVASLRPKMLAALLAAFQKHDGKSKRADTEWGWRVAGNALLDFGEEGTAALRAVRDQRDNLALAEKAWRVVDLTQRMNSFSEVTEKENDSAMKRRPTRSGADASPAAATVGTPVGQTAGGAPGPLHLRVHPTDGDDSGDGVTKPFKTIARAIKAAQPGDTIHLAPLVYRDYAGFYKKQGAPGRQITLDGHGAILEGSDPLDPAKWREEAPGLFRCDDLLPRFDDAMLGRWFFLFDGRMQLMGRTSKGPSAPLKKPEELQPGEWTFVKDPARASTKPGEFFGSFFLQLAPGKTLAAARISVPVRAAGVQFSGDDNAHITIRNVIATHVYNDGYNIHGSGRNLVFENIAAIECGDDGFSAHEAAECRIDGFVSVGNSTGLCDTVSSVTHFKNLFIKDCHGFDVFFIGDSPHSIENGVIESRAARAFSADQHTDRPQNGLSRVRLKNVRFRRLGGPQEIRVNREAQVTAERCTFLGLSVQVTPGGAMSATNCVFGGDPKSELLLHANTLWRGAGNHYDFHSARVGPASFTAQDFAGFQKLTGTDQTSHWPGRAGANDAGADEAVLTGIERRAADILQRWKETK